MKIQIKSTIAPPIGNEEKKAPYMSLRNMTITRHRHLWVYEPNEESESKSVTIPEWLEPTKINIYVHDTEGWSYPLESSRIICSRQGRPLSPYFIAEHNELVDHDAAFSISMPFARIEFNPLLFIIKISEVEGLLHEDRKATIHEKAIYDGPISTAELYCKTCKSLVKVKDREDHPSPIHDLVFSRANELQDIPHYHKAIRAAYKKGVYRIKAACFVDRHQHQATARYPIRK